MKRISIKIVALILAFGCILTTGAFAIYDVETALPIEDGEMSVAPAQATLDAYFNARSGSLNEPAQLRMQDNEALPVSAEIANDVALRVESLIDFWANEDVAIVSTTTTSHTISATQLSRSADINAIVYEWTWLDYVDGDSSYIDRMGFATVHDMTLAPSDSGVYIVARDSYDEVDISGHTSADYDPVAFEQATVGIDTMPLFSAITEEENTMPANNWPDFAPRALSGNATNVLASIDYADKWVIHDIANDYDSHTSNYNTRIYGTAPGNDCANFVSQCLRAGGLKLTSTSSASGWYHPEDGSTGCSAAWWNVDAFTTYWKKTYTQTNSSNGVLPGNPVFYLDNPTDHIAFCVGYNSAGSPIINGHTRDVYHQKLNSIYTYTINFNTVSPFISTPQWATSISMPGSITSGPYIQAEKAEWFKFTPSTSGSHTIYSTGNVDTYGVLYAPTKQGTKPESDGIMQLFELARDDDSGTNYNFSITATLTAGTTYYFMVRGSLAGTTGNFGLVLQ